MYCSVFECTVLTFSEYTAADGFLFEKKKSELGLGSDAFLDSGLNPGSGSTLYQGLGLDSGSTLGPGLGWMPALV